MTNEILVQEFEPLVKQSGLEKAEVYAATFAPFMIQLKQLSEKAATINHDNPTPLDAKLAREVRLAMAKNRTASEKQKDTSKASLLAEGNLIQSLYNVVANASKLSEADLDSVEKFAENKEKERVEAIRKERVELLSPYVEDTTIFPLGTMTAEQFDTMLNGYKLSYQQAKDAAEKAEAERLAKEQADKLEQERIRQENERLKKVAEEKEAALQAEREAAAKALEAERAETARLAKIEADKQAAILKAEQDKAAAERAALEEAARKEADKAAAEQKRLKDIADKAAAELKAKQDAEEAERQRLAKIEADRITAEKKAAKAPVKEKLTIAINGLTLVLPESEISADIMAKFNGFKTWALQTINTL